MLYFRVVILQKIHCCQEDYALRHIGGVHAAWIAKKPMSRDKYTALTKRAD